MSPRIEMASPAAAEGTMRELFAEVQQRYGAVPHVFRMIGNSEAALAAYIGISTGLDVSTHDLPLRESIALTVAEVNGCGYCLSAHTAIGKSIGLDADAIVDARRARSADPMVQAALTFAQRLVESRGHVSDEELAAFRAAGYTAAEVIEVIAQVTHDTFTNYVAIATQTTSEFPPVAPLERQAA